METIKDVDSETLGQEIKAMLTTNEKVLGCFAPDKITMLVNCAAAIATLVFFCSLIPSDNIACDITEKHSKGCGLIVKYILYFLAGTLLLATYISTFTKYVVTDRRILFRRGIWNIDFISIPFDKIQGISLSIGAINNMLFGVGNINIDTANVDCNGSGLSNMFFIKSPHEVYNLVQAARNNFRQNNK